MAVIESALIGTATRKTVAGATVLATGVSTVGSVHLIGIMVHASVTGNTTIQLWAGTTATSTAAGVPISGVMTFTSAATSLYGDRVKYLPFPARASGGLCLNTAGDTVDVTLYWNPGAIGG